MNDIGTDERIQESITEALLVYFRRGGRLENPVTRVTEEFPTTPHLLALHWAFGAEIRHLLSRLIERQGEIESSSDLVREQASGRIRGSVMWPATLARRRATSDPAITLYRDVRRTYETGPNKVIRYVVERALNVLEPYARDEEILDSPYGIAIRDAFALGTRCRRALTIRTKVTASSEEPPTGRDLMQALQSRRAVYRLGAAAFISLRNIEAGLISDRVKLLEETIVGPLERWRQFELFVMVKVAVALAARLETKPELDNLTPLMKTPAIRFGGLGIYWGVRPVEFYHPRLLDPNEERTSKITERFGLPLGSGRPDILIVDLANSEVLSVLECKYSTQDAGDVQGSFRDAIGQLVNYTQDYGVTTADARLGRSAVVMRRLPQEHETRQYTGNPADPILLSTDDLLTESDLLRSWIDRILPP